MGYDTAGAPVCVSIIAIRIVAVCHLLSSRFYKRMTFFGHLMSVNFRVVWMFLKQKCWKWGLGVADKFSDGRKNTVWVVEMEVLWKWFILKYFMRLLLEIWKDTNYQLLTKFLADMITQEVKRYVPMSTNLLILFGITKNCHSSRRNLLLYLCIRMATKLPILIMEEYHCHQLHTKYHPAFFIKVNSIQRQNYWG